jgi:TolB-like protein/tRNA A-37 threonylcarbamoyl transferase component Bud32
VSQSNPTERVRAALTGRYEIVREIGSGGMATVYLARDLKHGRIVAIKVLRAELAATVGSERFLREITVTAGLDHPHILPLLDSGEAAGLLYYVMPYVEGETLRDRLRREKQLSVHEALRITHEVADGLGYAHERGIVHRDIKPENVLLGAGHARIADFGIARAFSVSASDGLTGTGISVGTPSYMSPEQAAGEQNLDARSDLFSLAALLYEMLAGSPPFVAATPQSLVARIIADPVVPVRRVRSSVPVGVEHALSRALEKIPADRYPTARAFVEALAAPEPSVLPTAIETKRISGHTRRATAGVLGTAALIAAIAFGWRAFTAPAEASNAIQSLVVLPLENLTGDDTQDYFVEGLHDALIGELARISALRVMSRTSAMLYQESDKTVPQIAAELGVDAAIEGSVFRSGDTIRIQVQLIAARPERHIWTDAYERHVGSATALLGEVARTIAGEIRVSLTSQEADLLASHATISPEAQDHYLQGLKLLYSRDPAGMRRAILELNRAVQLDSAYAQAHAALASAYGLAVVYRAEPPDSAYLWAARALAAANKAIALDPSGAEAHGARGYLGLWLGAPVERVERDLVRALELKPSYAEAHGWFAQHLARLGREVEARDAIERALELDPVSRGMKSARINVGHFLGDWEDVLMVSQAVNIADPDYEIAWGFRGIALAALGRGVECLSLERLTLSAEPICLHVAGRAAEAQTKLAGAPVHHRPLYFALSGQLDRTLDALRLLAEMSPYLPASPGIYQPLVDLEGDRFPPTLEQIQREAWDRVVRESQTVELR